MSNFTDEQFREKGRGTFVTLKEKSPLSEALSLFSNVHIH